MPDDAEFQRLVAQYESNSNNFQKAFGITLAIGLFIALTVLLPYYLNIYDYDQNRLLIENENETILANNITYTKLVASAQKLNQSIEKLSNNIKTTSLMMNTGIKEVNDSLSNADKLLLNINDPAIYEVLTTKLNKTKYQENKTLEGAKIILGSLDKSIKMFEGTYSTKLKKLAFTESKISNSSSIIKNAITKREALNHALQNLTDRWKEVQSPFGNLPIDFTNLLAIFPIALTSGYILSGIWLKESIRLRSYIQKKFDTANISRFAPLWIEPNQNPYVLFFQFLLFFMPFLIFLSSILMIGYAWEHAPTPPFSSGSEINKAVYYASYGVCMGLFLFIFFRVVHQVWKYGQSKNSWIPGKSWG
jgi:hypothetical protein